MPLKDKILGGVIRKPIRYWENKSNQRAFFDSIAKKFNITSPPQWGNIDARTFQKNGGNTILFYYKNSLFKALRSVYSGKLVSILKVTFQKWNGV